MLIGTLFGRLWESLGELLGALGPFWGAQGPPRGTPAPLWEAFCEDLAMIWASIRQKHNTFIMSLGKKKMS